MRRLINADELRKEICAVKEVNKSDILIGIDYAPTVLTIPDNPTNGDMQLILCPELEVRDFGSFVEAHSPNVEMRVSKSWWNSPYKS